MKLDKELEDAMSAVSEPTIYSVYWAKLTNKQQLTIILEVLNEIQ